MTFLELVETVYAAKRRKITMDAAFVYAPYVPLSYASLAVPTTTVKKYW